MKARLINESLNESSKSSPIDMNKLKEYANAIKVICNGEYGETYFNEEKNKVYIVLGDANPFGDENLEWFMKEAIAVKYDREKEIEVEIENESGPPRDGNWKLIK